MNKVISKVILDISIKYKASVIRDIENCGKNYGVSAGRDIFLGDFDDPEIELVAFFHELGHVLSNERVCKRGYTMSKLSGEGLAWELGLGIAFEHGYLWDYNSYQMKWARKQLESYIKTYHRNLNE